VSADADQWEEFYTLADVPKIESCDLHATAAGQTDCVPLFLTTDSDGIVSTSTGPPFSLNFNTFHLVLGGDSESTT
jgi:hypothetical protein